MSDPALVYHYSLALADEERATEYRRGGFLRVQLGDILHSRYHLLQKLGRGSFATVWLAYDKCDDKWVSLKILRADHSVESKELYSHEQIQRALAVDTLTPVNIVHLIDHFEYQSIYNETHQCLVFELLGPSVYCELSQNAAFDLFPGYEDTEEIFRMTIRLLQGMSALHQAGYAWGDPSPKNFAYTFPLEQYLSRQQILDIVGPVEETTLTRLDGQPLDDRVPQCLVSSARFPDWPIDDYEDDFRILDLGSAFPIGEQRIDHPQPMFMQPPERIFDHQVGYETDSWGAGIMIYYFIFASSPPFSDTSDTFRVHSMVDYIGPVPQRWHAKWESMRKHAKKNDRWPQVVPGSVLEEQFANAEHTRDVKSLLPVIRGLMHWIPEARDSPKQALDSVVRICEHSENEDLGDLIPTDYKHG